MQSHIPIIPFIGTWPSREMLLPTTLDSLLPRRNSLLQLFKPVQYDVDLRGGGSLFGRLDHQEPLTVRGHIIGRADQRPVARKILPLEKHMWLARGKAGLRGNVHSHHLVPAAVEQVPPVAVPYSLRTAVRRDLPLAPWPRIGLHVNFIAARFIRDVSQPVPVGGKPWFFDENYPVTPMMVGWLLTDSVSPAERIRSQPRRRDEFRAAFSATGRPGAGRGRIP
jgi:hypothetical protein